MRTVFPSPSPFSPSPLLPSIHWRWSSHFLTLDHSLPLYSLIVYLSIPFPSTPFLLLSIPFITYRWDPMPVHMSFIPFLVFPPPPFPFLNLSSKQSWIEVFLHFGNTDSFFLLRHSVYFFIYKIIVTTWSSSSFDSIPFILLFLFHFALDSLVSSIRLRWSNSHWMEETINYLVDIQSSSILTIL